MNAKTEALSLEQVFLLIDELPWDHTLYLPPGTPTLETRCLVLDTSDMLPEEDLPAEARAEGMREILGVIDIRDIRSNARQQGRKPTMEEYLRAFLHYLERDAFLEFP